MVFQWRQILKKASFRASLLNSEKFSSLAFLYFFLVAPRRFYSRPEASLFEHESSVFTSAQREVRLDYFSILKAITEVTRAHMKIGGFERVRIRIFTPECCR